MSVYKPAGGNDQSVITSYSQAGAKQIIALDVDLDIDSQDIMGFAGCCDVDMTIITAGPNVTIDGTGTVDDPYVISAVPAGGISLEVSNTDSIDLNLAGTGSSGSPWVISGEVAYSTEPSNQASAGTDGGIFVPLPSVTVEAGVTNSIGDTTNGVFALDSGDTLHFWSSTATIGIEASNGVVDLIDVNGNEVITNSNALTGSAPALAELGVDNSSGQLYYPNLLGNWRPILNNQYYDTIADLNAAKIPIEIEEVTVLGRMAVHDGGYQVYKRAAIEPTHNGKSTSNSGTVHWEVRGDINPVAFGVEGDGSTDDTAAFQNLVDYMVGEERMLFLDPDSTYILDSVDFPIGLKLDGRGATLQLPDAAADNTTIFDTTSTSTVLTRDILGGYIKNVKFDGNKQNRSPYTGNEKDGSALVVLDADSTTPYRLRFILENVEFLNSTGDGIQINRNTDVRLSNTTGQGNFLNDIHAVGGWSKIDIYNHIGFTDDGLAQTTDSLPSYIHLGVANTGYAGSQRLDLNLENVDIDRLKLEQRSGGIVNLNNVETHGGTYFLGNYYDVQILDDSALTAGTYILTDSSRNDTNPIAWNANSALVESELESLPTINDVIVSDVSLPPLPGQTSLRTAKSIQFIGSGHLNKVIPVFSIDDSSATGTGLVYSIEGQPQLVATNCKFRTRNADNLDEIRNLFNAKFVDSTFELIDVAGNATPKACYITTGTSGLPNGSQVQFERCKFKTAISDDAINDGVTDSAALYIVDQLAVRNTKTIIRDCQFSDFRNGILNDRGGFVEVWNPTFKESVTRGIWWSATNNGTYDSRLLIGGKVTVEGTQTSRPYLHIENTSGNPILEHQTSPFDQLTSRWSSTASWDVEVRGVRQIFDDSVPTNTDVCFIGDIWTIQPTGQDTGEIQRYTALNTHPSTSAQWSVLTHDEVIENAGALAGAAPFGARFGLDTTTGTGYYVDSGNWAVMSVGTSNGIVNTVTITTNGTSNGVTVAGNAIDPEFDILLRSEIADNNLSTAIDGGLYYNDPIDGINNQANGLSLSISNDLLQVEYDTDTLGQIPAIDGAADQIVIRDDGSGNYFYVVPDQLATVTGYNTNGNSNGISVGGSGLTPTVDILTISADISNASIEGSDGGVWTPNEIIESAGELTGSSPTGAKLGVDTDGAKIYYVSNGVWTIIPDSANGIVETLGIQTNGNSNGVSNNGSATNPRFDVTLLSGDNHNVLSEGSDGGLYYSNGIAGINDQTNGMDIAIVNSNIQVAFSLDELNQILSIDISNDRVLLYDAGGGVHGYVEPSQLVVNATYTTDGTSDGIDVTGTAFSPIVDITLLSTDPSNDLSTGSDGGLFYDTPVTGTNDKNNGLDVLIVSNNIEVDYDFSELPQIADVDGATDRVLVYDSSLPGYTYALPNQLAQSHSYTVNGSSNAVTVGGTALAPTLDILTLSADADNALTEGGDGGLYMAGVAQDTFNTLAAFEAADVAASVNRVYVLGYAAANDGGYQEYIREASEPPHSAKAQSNDGAWWSMTGKINASAFGALPTNNASQNNITMSAWADAVAELAPSNYVECYVPPGTYILNPFLGNANTTSGVTFDLPNGASVDICGYGAELKFEDNAFSGMVPNSDFRHLLYLQPSTDNAIIEKVRILGFTVNGNMANQPDPITQGDFTDDEYEQAALIKEASTGSDVHTRIIECHDITILDPMADGIYIGPAFYGLDLDNDGIDETTSVDQFRFSNIYEGPRSDLAKRSTVLTAKGVREVVGDRCFSDQTGSGGSIQTEFTGIIDTIKYRISLSQCDVGWYDFSGPSLSARDHYEVNLSQCKSQRFCAFGWVRIIANQCDLKMSDGLNNIHPNSYIEISDSIIRLGVDDAPVSNKTVYFLGNTNTGTPERINTYDNVRFLIDSDDPVFATAKCIETNNDLDTQTKYTFNNCWFDPRFTTSIDTYNGGHVRTRNCVFGGTFAAFGTGNQSASFSTKIESHNDDFSLVTGEVLHVYTVTPPSNTDIRFYGGVYPSNMTGFTTQDAQLDYQHSFNFSSRVIPVSNITTEPGGGIKGDIAWNYRRDVQWRAIDTHHNNATWVQLSTGSGSADRKNNQDTLSNDVSNIIMSSGMYDNKEVTLTQDAKFTLSTTDPGVYYLLVKSDDGSVYNLDWQSNVLGGPPPTVSSTNGIAIKMYYDGTNFHV